MAADNNERSIVHDAVLHHAAPRLTPLAKCTRHLQGERNTHHGEFITLVAGKRRSFLMAGNDKVYDKKPQRYTKDNRTAHLTACSDKSVNL